VPAISGSGGISLRHLRSDLSGRKLRNGAKAQAERPLGARQRAAGPSLGHVAPLRLALAVNLGHAFGERSVS
jgi:hypothetical protein